MKGCDAPREVASVIPQIKAAGLGFVARYFSFNGAKNLSASEAQRLSAAGIKIVSVFEARGDVYSSFTAAQGAKDAAQALQLAAQVGQPKGSGVYFAVDFDASADQIAGGISAYFAAVNDALHGQYRVGVYGSGLVCESLGDAGLAELFWLACAGGWQGTRDFTGQWHIRQSLPSSAYHLGFPVDPDEAIDGIFGQWELGRQNVDDVDQAPANDPVALCRQMQRALGVEDDADPGPATRSAMRKWRAAHPS